MSDFKIDPKLYDTLSDEQKKLLNATLDQHTQMIKNEYKGELTNEINVANASKTEAQKQKEAFLNTVSGDREMVNQMLDLGMKPDDIKTKFPKAFEAKEVKQDNPANPNAQLNLEALINGFVSNQAQAQPNQPLKESDEAFLKRINSGDFDADKDLDRYNSLTNK